MHLPELEGYGSIPVILSDTVGFIKHLPTTLIEAFGATLEEAAQADLLLHVVDMASTNREAQITQVNKVLHDIRADQVPQILILNQIDRIECEAGFDRDEHGRIVRIRVSAKTGAGVEYIRLALQEHYAYLKKMSTEKSAYA